MTLPSTMGDALLLAPVLCNASATHPLVAEKTQREGWHLLCTPVDRSSGWMLVREIEERRPSSSEFRGKQLSASAKVPASVMHVTCNGDSYLNHSDSYLN
jgi:hypothetical protein